jgi:hypothetical protein
MAACSMKHIGHDDRWRTATVGRGALQISKLPGVCVSSGSEVLSAVAKLSVIHVSHAIIRPECNLQ